MDLEISKQSENTLCTCMGQGG